MKKSDPDEWNNSKNTSWFFFNVYFIVNKDNFANMLQCILRKMIVVTSIDWTEQKLRIKLKYNNKKYVILNWSQYVIYMLRYCIIGNCKQSLANTITN
jgi:hypothetical protein